MGCKREIDITKDKYVHVEDWNGTKKEAESWWHLKCFVKAMNRELTEIEKMAGEMLNKAKTAYDNLPEDFKKEKPKEYIING